jgi:hypothetical protein
MAATAIWKATQRPWLTTFAPILIGSGRERAQEVAEVIRQRMTKSSTFTRTRTIELAPDTGGMHPRAFGTLARKATTGESRHRFGGPPELPAQMTVSV